MLSRVFHCYPHCTDRYTALKTEIGSFIDTNKSVGLRNLIAIGAFEIGMELFLYELADSFNTKIYMPQEQRAFLDELVDSSQHENDMTVILRKLRDHVVDDQSAMIHVLKVEEITNEVSYTKSYDSNSPNSKFFLLL